MCNRTLEHFHKLPGQDEIENAQALKFHCHLREHMLDQLYDAHVAASVLMTHAVNACMVAGLDAADTLRMMNAARRGLVEHNLKLSGRKLYGKLNRQ